jgi:uroporphyrinogen-III synthase
VANLFALADEAGSTDSLRRALNGPVVAMCVGPVCGDALAARGATAVLPERARLGAMVHRLTEELSARRRTVSLAGVAAVVQGSVVLVDGQEVTLSDRESDVLAILLERNGGVVPRAELMRRVWGAGRDEHALEATITRLRARLGPAGRAVRTVVRRGYRVELD